MQAIRRGSLNYRRKSKGELNKTAIKTKLAGEYRRRDKQKYEAERRVIMENLRNYEAEMEEIKRKLSELEVVPI